MLHGNLIHVVVNGLALHIAGGLVERLDGLSARLLMVLALSGVAGALASHFSGSAPFSVGFSGALFGLFGGAWRPGVADGGVGTASRRLPSIPPPGICNPASECRYLVLTDD